MSSIWPRSYSIEDISPFSKGNMVEHVGIEITEIGDDYIKATMPVDERTKQPFGLLHGGASVVLAETLGSMAGNMIVGPAKVVVGVEINANHLRSVKSGKVTGTAKPFHLGRSTQVWEIQIRDDQDRLNCVSRITLAVVDPG